MRVEPLFLPFLKADHLDLGPLRWQLGKEEAGALRDGEVLADFAEEQVVVRHDYRVGERLRLITDVTEDDRWVAAGAVEDVPAEVVAGHEARIPPSGVATNPQDGPDTSYPQ